MSSMNNFINKTKLDFALFGVGRIGLCHLQSILRHPRIRLKCVVEENTGYAQDVLDRMGVENVAIVSFSDMEDVLSDERYVHIYVILESCRARFLALRPRNAQSPNHKKSKLYGPDPGPTRLYSARTRLD